MTQKNILLSILFLSLVVNGFTQNYTSYFTGDTTDIDVQPLFGIALAGGAGDNDDAMKWFLERANGGDILVLRASGADGYNDYFFSDLGVPVNSVETILCNNADASYDDYVITQIENAEAIFFAGGDQWNYVSYWKDTPIEDAINNHMLIKQGPIGGTSAGMAILGGHYFTAENGTVYSEEALEDPFNTYMTIGHHDFLQTPFLHDVITDTHYDDPDRRARHMTFLARIFADGYPQALGIACNEYTCVCIDETGLAHVYGEYPLYEEYAYFLRHGCLDLWTPENCVSNQPLTWERDETALYVLKSPGTTTGVNIFSVTDWLTWNGGDWQEWWAIEGVFNVNPVSFGPECPLDYVTSITENIADKKISVYPNPASQHIYISSEKENTSVSIYDVTGTLLIQTKGATISTPIPIQSLASGIYQFLITYNDGSTSSGKFVVKEGE